MTMEGPDIGFTTIIGAGGRRAGKAVDELTYEYTCNICILKLVTAGQVMLRAKEEYSDGNEAESRSEIQ